MLEVINLTKKFNNVTVVNNVNFTAKTGEVIGFIGPNGAGKSTTMKMITGFLPPTDGTILVNKLNIEQHPLVTKQLMGYLPENTPLYVDMTVRQFLTFIAEIRGFTGTEKTNRIDDMIYTLHLTSVLNQTIDTLSKGFKCRVGLAQALIHDPKILILDEPTDGLDPNQKYAIRKLILQIAAEKIIIISTHILEEVTAICNRALILANGKIAVDSTPEALLLRSSTGQLDEVFRVITEGYQRIS